MSTTQEIAEALAKHEAKYHSDSWGHVASDVGQIAAGGVAAGGTIAGINAAGNALKKRKKQQMAALMRRVHEFNGIGTFAKGATVIAAGDLAGEGVLDEVEKKLKRKKARALVSGGIEQKTDTAGGGQTSLAAAYHALRFDYKPRTIDLAPKKDKRGSKKDKRGWLARNKYKVAGTAVGLAGSLAFLRRRTNFHQFAITRRDSRGRQLAGDDIHSTLRHARKHVIVARRAGQVAQDIGDDLEGKKTGRRKKFYQKEWFKTAAGTAALAGTALVAGRLLRLGVAHRNLRNFMSFVNSPDMPPIQSQKMPDPATLAAHGLKPNATRAEWLKAQLLRIRKVTQFASIGSEVASDVIEQLVKPSSQPKKKKINPTAKAVADEADPDPGLGNNMGLLEAYLKLRQFAAPPLRGLKPRITVPPRRANHARIQEGFRLAKQPGYQLPSTLTKEEKRAPRETLEDVLGRHALADYEKKRINPVAKRQADSVGPGNGVMMEARRKLRQFTLLAGKKSDYRRPIIKETMYMPANRAAYQSPKDTFASRKVVKAHIGEEDAKDHELYPNRKEIRRGRILISDSEVPEDFAKQQGGYENGKQLKKALKRHEIIHSIQHSKGGDSKTIRDVFAREIGAYRHMDRGVKGGNPLLRGKDKIMGALKSTYARVVQTPALKARIPILRHFLEARHKLTQFYGTSAGVSAAWDTRGRNADRKTTWWTHSPSRNSVRVVRSASESGPRQRRGKKPYERASFQRKALAAAGIAALGLGGLALHGHLKLRNARKVLNQSKVRPIIVQDGKIVEQAAPGHTTVIRHSEEHGYQIHKTPNNHTQKPAEVAVPVKKPRTSKPPPLPKGFFKKSEGG